MSDRKKIVLVTGASSGIGHATAIEFAQKGFKVYAGARRLEPMEDLKQYGVIPIQLDVTSNESVLKLKEIIKHDNGGYLDVLYNNAGQSCTVPALDIPDDWAQRCYEVNVFAPMRLVRELGPYVINAQGCIGFTGSVSGVVPFPLSSVYSSSKAAIHAYAAGLRIEMKPFNVKILNFVTGGVKTHIADTRSIPKGSIYDIPEMELPLKNRQEMAKKNNPISAEAYAKQVVNDFINAKSVDGSLNYYRGAKSYLLGWLLFWCPRFIVEKILISKFKLVPVYDFFQHKYSKEKME
ncbi:NADPH-dependent 1-acyl dihydroxyacetone phosphate reductase [Scheffersomyces spartinae]|uniref:NADPH-dependent 1-acyl dihydroxyacetone phosphate reductase n=1 Tax=Scheffersomyces spartinae TaxID=45513 RepID=A0A9P8AIP1_9ASCO|nr:NADPH-dependent 1-acyl dihydroxyacetone phosphate reductase [Scheffersomyces spartinae]KAG7193890.1 NADPH-dependent 1-acyl dihydroxyacetone phosphate reductase [Scheffersomyces spartinae]